MAESTTQPISGAPRVRCGILVLGRRAPGSDLGGQKARKMLTDAGHEVVAYEVAPPTPEDAVAVLERWVQDASVQAILSVGGVGYGDGDATFAAIQRLIQTPIPGFGQLLHMLAWPLSGSGAMLYRAAAGSASGKPLIVLPDSTAVIELAVGKLVLPEIDHLVRVLAPKA